MALRPGAARARRGASSGLHPWMVGLLDSSSSSRLGGVSRLRPSATHSICIAEAPDGCRRVLGASHDIFGVSWHSARLASDEFLCDCRVDLIPIAGTRILSADIPR